jgi:hypothetical protein
MGNHISAFENASTPSQLKYAVDALPRNNKYFTEEVRDLLIAKKDLIVDAGTADSVLKFLLSFSKVESRRPLLQTKEVHDLIINNIAPHVTKVYEFGRTICRIVAKDADSAKRFSGIESFTAILKCFHRSKTSEDARWIAASINNILAHNPSSNKLLNSLPVVEAFSFIIPLVRDHEAVISISNALQRLLLNNEDAQNKFGTPEFLKIFQGMEKHATTDDSKKPFKSVGENIKPIADRREALQKPLLDSTSPRQLASALEFIAKQQDRLLSWIELLLQQQHLIQDQESAVAVANFIKWFGEKDLKSIARKEIFELIENVLLPKFSNMTDSIFDAFAILFKEESARNYFAKTSFRDFVSSSLHVHDFSLLRTLDLLLSKNVTAKEIFGNSEFKKKFLAKLRTSTSTEYKNIIIQLLNEAIFESLKNLAREHKSDIDVEILKKLADLGIDAAKFHVLDSVVLKEFGFGASEIIDITVLVKSAITKNPSLHQAGHQDLSGNAYHNVGDGARPFPPGALVFQSGVPACSWKEAVERAMSLRELPKDEKGNDLRPDLKNYIPDDDSLAAVLRFAETELAALKEKDDVKALIAKCGLTDDDIRALWIYKAQNPYALYRWLNAWLTASSRRPDDPTAPSRPESFRGEDRIKVTIGPLFVRIYRAMEKLPRIKCKASRGALVDGIPALVEAFKNYETRFKPKQLVSFWGFGSFSQKDLVASSFSGGATENAFIYTCAELEGVDMDPFTPQGMSRENEILPLCPAVFDVVSAIKVVNTKVAITMKQLDHSNWAYVVPGQK